MRTLPQRSEQGFCLIKRLLCCLLPILMLPAPGLTQTQQGSPYTFNAFREQAGDVKWETAAFFAGITAVGLHNWNWGSSNRFNTNPEGWFGEDTGSGGADKLGHAFTSYAITNVLTDSLLHSGHPPRQSALTAALISQALMLYVEIFDGYSDDHGFAYEDLIANMGGTALAYLRAVYPRLKQTVDFRMEYDPSGYRGFRPLSDYSGQTYMLAFKLGGSERLRHTPLRHVDLQLGYYTRGFSEEERLDGRQRQRYAFAGIGLNLLEVFYGRREPRTDLWDRSGRLFFEHIQLPYTSVRANERL
jgi:hypothetical protein